MPFTISEQAKAAQGVDQFVTDNITKLRLVFLLRHRGVVDVHGQGDDALAITAPAFIPLDKLRVLSHQEFRRKNALSHKIDIA